MPSRLQQIDDALRTLEIRREELVRQREHLLLAERSRGHGTTLSPDEKVALFLSLFRCRSDVYPKLWENPTSGRKGYSPACRNEWKRGVCEKPRIKCSECLHQAFAPLDEAAARAHLMGEAVIGTYAIRADNSCIFLAADFDGSGWKAGIRAYRDAAQSLGVKVTIERSRSGEGGHAWIFFLEPVPALVARRLGTMIMAKASSLHPAMTLASYDRFFPNQDRLPAGGFGNLIALPLQAKARKSGNSAFLDDDFNLHEDPWDFLSKVDRIDRARLDDLLKRHMPAESEGEFENPPNYEDRILDIIPAAVEKGAFTGSVAGVRVSQLEIPLAGLPSSLVAALKRIGTLANPVFFEKQRLRFGTWDTPRFIFCGESHPDRLVLPRGVIPAAEALFRKAGGRLLVEDRREPARAHPFEFNGDLTPGQNAAVEAMLRHDDGVLLAPPGAGKTVIGCAMIASRKVSTLVLVHRKPLLDQWRSRLQQFLGLESKDISILGKDGNLNAGGVAVGMIQTLVRSQHPGHLFAPFTQVIIDECHHIPAASFEGVMKICPARYFLGLTATPNRKDGLQKILFLHCGPIRHRMESATDCHIARRLIVRDIMLGLPPDSPRMPVYQVWELLANHEERNRQIASDIVNSLNAGRCCAVLSDRKAHLTTLEQMVREMAPSSVDRMHRIDGSVGKKARAAILDEASRRAAANEGFAIFSTSSSVGEGFDLPQLDTLFLTLPISFKERLIQYAGRLHRNWEGKSEVQIYDYVEPDHPLSAHMHRKRLKNFHGMGYETLDEDALLPGWGALGVGYKHQRETDLQG